MPLKRTAMERDLQPPREDEEAEPVAIRPRLEAVEAEHMEPGRPYQAFVESEAMKYWQEMVKIGSLTKPTQQEIREAAMPVLGLAQRNRPGLKLISALNRAQMAVNTMQLHLVESGRLKHPFTLSEASPNYVEALIQLADDAGWLAREIPLPDHPPQKHHTIYYTIDPETGRPIPRADSLIRGDYVYSAWDDTYFLKDSNIYPWRELGLPDERDLINRGWSACYSLYFGVNMEVEILLHWVMKLKIYLFGDLSTIRRLPLSVLCFSKYQPASAST